MSKNGKALAKWTRPCNSLADMSDVLNEIALAFGDETTDVSRLRGVNQVNNQRLAFFRLALKAGQLQLVAGKNALPAAK